jgi:hypothetical protein
MLQLFTSLAQCICLSPERFSKKGASLKSEEKNQINSGRYSSDPAAVYRKKVIQLPGLQTLIPAHLNLKQVAYNGLVLGPKQRSCPVFLSPFDYHLYMSQCLIVLIWSSFSRKSYTCIMHFNQTHVLMHMRRI